MPRTLILLLWLPAVVAFAQPSVVTNPGDQFYRAEQFSKALLWYADAADRDSTDWASVWMMGESLRQLFRYREALIAYRRVYQHATDQFPKAAFYYALMLQQQGRCSEALPLLEQFVGVRPADDPLVEAARVVRQDCFQTTPELSDTSTIKLVPLPSPINTAAHDFAAVPYQHDSSLLLTSGRWEGPGRTIDYRFGQNYTNLVMVERGERGWKERRPPTRRWNTPQHDGPGCFSADRTHFYFTRCQGSYCQIYQSVLRDKAWDPPTALGPSVNAPRSNNKHPSLSPGGDTLYFVSDRPGGYGGTDIWQCVRDAGGWGDARNVGEAVNTSADEVAPSYYAAEDLFFFASRGQGGAGDMDLYGVPWFTDRSASRVAHRLLDPFNSTSDDAFLTLGRRHGFLSTNRTGDFDVYRFAPDTSRRLAEQLLGQVSLPLVGPRSLSADLSNSVLRYELSISSVNSDIVIVRSVPEERLTNGASRFILNSNVNDIALRQLRASASQRSSPSPGRNATDPSDSTSLLALSTNVVPVAQRGEVMGRLYTVTGTQKVPAARMKVHLLNEEGTIMKITTTNDIGQFHFVNLAPQADYSVVLTDPPSTSDTTYQVENLVIQKYGEDVTTVPYETLYFDFNQSALRPEARVALSDLARYFRQHPQTAIEINAYADSLGNDSYNLLLSQQRGEAVFRYLLAQGVDPAALVINAQGISTALSSTNSLVSQQLNRRVEIQLIGDDVRYYPRAETRILRPNVNAEQLYQLEGLRANDLQQLNGRPIEPITPLKPLRIPVLEDPLLDQLFFDVTTQPQR